jgi:hypothetical protein
LDRAFGSPEEVEAAFDEEVEACMQQMWGMIKEGEVPFEFTPTRPQPKQSGGYKP